MVLDLLLAILALGLVLFGARVRVVAQFERGIVLRFGRLSGTPRGPGLTVISPVADRLHEVFSLVSRSVAQRARCPVVVVRTGKATADEHAESGRRTALLVMDPIGIEPVHRPTPWE